ncbi:MAG: NYN domain-containing protein [Candidatus Binatia bacterium]
MEIIVDGYNLIGSDGGLHGDLEHKRGWLIQRLSLYQRTKGFGVILVFDGWRSGSMDEVGEKKDGITVVYSRQGEKADSVIVRIARQKGSGCVVVTSDREVRSAVERFGATAIYSGEFGAIMRSLDTPFNDDEADLPKDRGLKKGNPRQLSRTERKRREKLRKLRP